MYHIQKCFEIIKAANESKVEKYWH